MTPCKKKLDHFGVSEKWRKYMRLSKAEKEEIIQVVERSELGVTRTLQELGIHKGTFYRWYKAYLNKSEAARSGAKPGRRQWNTIPEAQKNLVVEIALEHPDLSPRELAVKLTDEQQVFISESSVYRILKARGLITSPAHILLSASNEFKDKTMFVHQMWQTDFTQTSKSWAGVGITSVPYWMIIAALLSIGNSVGA